MQCENPFRVGEVVHYYFNGDAYPGVVTKVTKCTVSVQRIPAIGNDAELQEFLTTPNECDRVFHWSPKRKKFLNGAMWTLSAGYRFSLNREF